MRAGAARVDITPPFPADLQGYVRRDVAARAAIDRLTATALVLEGDDVTVAVIGADLANLDPDYAPRIRDAVADAVGCPPAHVLLNSSHTHAAPWPGQAAKISGEFLDRWLSTEDTYLRWLPSAFASVASRARARAIPALVSAGVGRTHGLAVNRRERNPDPSASLLARTILGWNAGNFVDEEVPTIRVDAMDGSPIVTVVAFGCHPCVLGPEVPQAGTDFVGPLRDLVERIRGGLCLYLAGAGGNILPAEGWHTHPGPEVAFGQRVGLEAVHAVADADPRITTIQRFEYRSLVPIAYYRRIAGQTQPEPLLRVASRIVDLPLLEPGSADELREELVLRRSELTAARDRAAGGAITNPMRVNIRWLEETLLALEQQRIPSSRAGEVWALRVGDIGLVGAPGEVFSEIGHAVRAGSPATVTLFAGYSNGCLGYVPTRAEYAQGGYEPLVSHRNYGQPAGLAPEAGERIEGTALELLAGLFQS